MKTPYYNVPNLQKIADLEAEVARLKEENAHFAWRDTDKNRLIAELADALEEEFGESRDLMQGQQRPWNLIQRAREATK